MTNQTPSLDVSLVIPLLNEEESLQELVSWISRVCDSNNLSFEVILVDDGSKDQSWSVIKALSTSDQRIKGIRFRRNYGKSAALNAGFEQVNGQVVITMDADLQDSPDEIPELVAMIRSGNDLVSGWKQKRYDPLTKTIPTRLFNWATRKMSGINNLHDFNCGLKAYRHDVVKNIEVYGEMHRYIPVIAKWAGFTRIAEKVVQHSPRKYGTTKFGLERFVNGFLDLLSITFVSRFGKRPMHFFGLLGTLSFLFGFGIAVKLAVDKYLFQVYNMTDRPIFFFGMLAMILGTQLFLAGFLGEMIARNAPDRNRYQISESANL
ncbi:MAG: glycosyltransferase family 2 protein [Bacteroidia bacterium]